MAVATSSGLTPVSLASCILASGAEARREQRRRASSQAPVGYLLVCFGWVFLQTLCPRLKGVVGLFVTELRRFLIRAAYEPLTHCDWSLVSPVLQAVFSLSCARLHKT